MGATNIYVVFGTTGEYSDRYEWPVKAFYDKKKAEDLVVEAEEIARTIKIEYDKYSKKWNNLRNQRRRTAWTFKKESAVDPNFEMDYTGTNYYIVETIIE